MNNEASWKLKALEQRRQRAVYLLQEGYPPVDVAAMLGVDRRSEAHHKIIIARARRQTNKSRLRSARLTLYGGAIGK